jgi:hypothetical protein
MSYAFEFMKGSYLETFSDETIDLIVECFTQGPRSCDVVFNFGHYMHGQVCRVVPEATAFGLRKARGVHLGFWAQWKEQAQANKRLNDCSPIPAGVSMRIS